MSEENLKKTHTRQILNKRIYNRKTMANDQGRQAPPIIQGAQDPLAPKDPQPHQNHPIPSVPQVPHGPQALQVLQQPILHTPT